MKRAETIYAFEYVLINGNSNVQSRRSNLTREINSRISLLWSSAISWYCAPLFRSLRIACLTREKKNAQKASKGRSNSFGFCKWKLRKNLFSLTFSVTPFFDALAPTAECESDTDCHESASCIDKKCICKGKTTGGGREDCRGEYLIISIYCLFYVMQCSKMVRVTLAVICRCPWSIRVQTHGDVTGTCFLCFV